jgi:3-methyladenine DNA glycosylase AlkC
MEPLKEMFNHAYYQKLASAVKEVHSSFNANSFQKDSIKDLSTRSLNERMRHTAHTLQHHLPDDYRKSISILKDTVTLMPSGYTALVFPEFVSLFGKANYQLSIDALKYFTRFGSSEFAIRTFLKLDLTKTLMNMYKWSEDDNVHVRRLASEGSRPRLPWSFKLDEIIQNPKLTRPIIENLNSDNELYVRKSVANHLNDQTKDSADYVTRLVKSWDRTHPHTAWIVKRGCRSLLKQGHKQSMAIFNLSPRVDAMVKNFTLNSRTIKLNEKLEFQFSLVSTKNRSQRLMIDYRIHYTKKTGVQLPKVFKLKEITLNPKQEISIKKMQRFQDFTTRELHSGTHLLEIVINGLIVKSIKFEFIRN